MAATADDARLDASPERDDDDSRSSSSDSPAPIDNEESDFFLGNNDSQSSLGAVNLQDMQVMDDACWPPINRLPNEILISIFSRLTAPADHYRITLVCRRWARNAVELLWHRPACTSWNSHRNICQTLAADKPFFSYRDFVKRLNLAALGKEVNDGSVLPLAVCTRIERLTLTNCAGLTDTGLTALLQKNRNLLALDVSNDRNITETSIYTMAENCQRLQGLNISGCTAISNQSLIALAKSCRYIKRVRSHPRHSDLCPTHCPPSILTLRKICIVFILSFSDIDAWAMSPLPTCVITLPSSIKLLTPHRQTLLGHCRLTPNSMR